MIADIPFDHLSRVVQADFLECVQFFEKVQRGLGRIVGRTARNETQILSKWNCLHSVELWVKL